MKVILAQGNPEPHYDKTRHNTGFMVLNAIANAQNASWTLKTRLRAHVAETSIDDTKVILVKPTTFYNETGISARAVVDFYKLDPKSDLLVLHDDLALPFGTIRVRLKGSDAGNNGIKSLNSHIGPDYTRIRIGIWNDKRNQMDDADFVLSKFSLGELRQLNELIGTKLSDLISDFTQGKLKSSSYTLQ